MIRVFAERGDDMKMDRRAFIKGALGAVAAACGGCASGGGVGASTAARPGGGPVDIGTAADYPRDGVYDRFIRQRFFVLRRAGSITAMSNVCTHRNCTVRYEEGDGFICPCHGARFDAEGKVTGGPAPLDLPHFPVTEGADGHLYVHPA
jgi:cytochrome b6-f complex iron-sulfur subunit